MRFQNGSDRVPIDPTPDDEMILESLRALPEVSLPEEDIEAIFDQTIRAAHPMRLPILRRTGLALAAAACLGLSALGAWLTLPPASEGDGLSELELVELERDLQMTLAMVSSTLSQAEQIAVRDVLIEEAAGVLVPFARE